MAMLKQDDSKQHAYEVVAEIGKGAYGTVYKARDIKNQGKFVAVKEIRILTRSEEGMPMSTIREIAMLQQLEKFEHPNIVRLLDVWSGKLNVHEMKLLLVFEHMNQDLAQYLEKSPSCGLSPDNIKDIMHQILNGVDFLHTNRIIHRDLKPQNILISTQGCVKIADFGLARIYSFHMALTTVVVTLYYRSPEVLLQDSYCTAVDIWSCGTILAELYLRKPLFQGTSEIDQLCKIFHVMGLPPADQWPTTCSLPRSSFEDVPKQPLKDHIPNIDAQAAELLEKMLIFDQRKRITIVEILQDPWFTEDADISMSSVSSDSFSLNTSGSSGDNMDSGYLMASKDAVNPTLNGVTSQRVLGGNALAKVSCQHPLHQINMQHSTAASTNSNANIHMSSHAGNGLFSHNSDVTHATKSVPSKPVQFTTDQPCTSGINMNIVQEPCRPSAISSNHFKDLYEQSACSNVRTMSTSHDNTNDDDQRQCYQPSVTMTSCSAKHYPLSATTTSSFPQKLAVTSSGFHQPITEPLSHYQGSCQHPDITSSNHHRPFQPIATVTGHSQEMENPPSGTGGFTLEQYRPSSNAVLSSNMAVINVPGHPRSNATSSTGSVISGAFSIAQMASNKGFRNQAAADTGSNTSGLQVTDQNKQSEEPNDCDTSDKQKIERLIPSKHPTGNKQYCSYLLLDDSDGTGLKKGVKRSRPF